MINKKQLNEGKATGQIYCDFDLPYDVPDYCKNCESELEWNGECSECGDC